MWIRIFFLNLQRQTIKTGGNRIKTAKDKMKTYILFEKGQNSVLGVYTDREVAIKMMQVYQMNYEVYCETREITNKVPVWAEKVLELNK